MTLIKNLMVAGLVLVTGLSGCNRPDGNCDDGDANCDTDVHTGETDDTPQNDPFAGDDTVEISFNPRFDGESEMCYVNLTCTSNDGLTRSQTLPSTDTFTVDADANCEFTLGQKSSCVAQGDRPCHKSGDGRLWTYAEDLGTGFEDGDVFTPEANWYFAADRVTCVANGFEHISTDVAVDDRNTFELFGIASGNSWIQVVGATIDLGGLWAEKGYHVTSATLSTKSLTFDYTGLTSTHVECTW